MSVCSSWEMLIVFSWLCTKFFRFMPIDKAVSISNATFFFLIIPLHFPSSHSMLCQTNPKCLSSLAVYCRLDRNAFKDIRWSSVSHYLLFYYTILQLSPHNAPFHAIDRYPKPRTGKMNGGWIFMIGTYSQQKTKTDEFILSEL